MKAIKYWAPLLLLGMGALFFSPGSKGQVLNSHSQIGNKIQLDTSGIRYQNGQPFTTSIKHKAIILDFWNIRCSACIADMPRFDSLQTILADSFQFILVTNNSKEESDNLFRRNGMILPHLAFIYDNSSYFQQIPHSSEPTHAWINKDSILDYVTFDYNASKGNIEKWLNGKKLDISQKKEYVDFKDNASILKNITRLPSVNLETYSIWGKGLYEYTSSNMIEIKRHEYGNPYFLKALNHTPLDFIGLAYNDELYGFPVTLFNLRSNYRIINKLTDPTVLTYPADKDKIDTWMQTNLLSYELLVKDHQDFYQQFRNDLQLKLRLKLSIIKKPVKSWVLIKIKPTGKLMSFGKSSKRVHYSKDKFEIVNGRMQDLIAQLVYLYQRNNIPVIDKTGIRTNIDLTLNCALLNKNNLKNELRKNGLDLVERTEKVKMLLIERQKTSAL